MNKRTKLRLEKVGFIAVLVFVSILGGVAIRHVDRINRDFNAAHPPSTVDTLRIEIENEPTVIIIEIN